MSKASKFRTIDGVYEFMPAEVIEVLYEESYANSSNINQLVYPIRVKLLNSISIDDDKTKNTFIAIPLNTTLVKIPIVGEIVLLYKSVNSSASGTKHSSTIYYIDTVGLQNQVNHNSLPTVSKIISNQTTPNSTNTTSYLNAAAGGVISIKDNSNNLLDSNFTENSLSKPLQHYIGDTLILGRYGQSLRFSTTPKSTSNFSKRPNWTGTDHTAPITILRNTRQNKRTGYQNDYQTEDFTNDDNLIVMASGQKLRFTQSSNTKSAALKNSLNSWVTEQWGITPQVLISSGRIVFNSTQKEILAFAKNGIALSSDSSIALDAQGTITLEGSKIELGATAVDRAVLGDSFNIWMNSLINALGSVIVTVPNATPLNPNVPLVTTSPLSLSPSWPAILSVLSQLPAQLSNSVYVKR